MLYKLTIIAIVHSRIAQITVVACVGQAVPYVIFDTKQLAKLCWPTIARGPLLLLPDSYSFHYMLKTLKYAIKQLYFFSTTHGSESLDALYL